MYPPGILILSILIKPTRLAGVNFLSYSSALLEIGSITIDCSPVATLALKNVQSVEILKMAYNGALSTSPEQ